MSKNEALFCVVGFIGGFLIALMLPNADYERGRGQGHLQATQQYAKNLELQILKFEELEKRICPEPSSN